MNSNSRIDITTLPLHTLLSNVEVSRLFQERSNLLAAQDKLNSALCGLLEATVSLTVKMVDMQRRLEVKEGKRLHHSPSFLQVLYTTVLSTTDSKLHSPTILTKSPSEDSISPSDSVSQRGCEDSYPMAPTFGTKLPAERPASFSPTVLWTLQECRWDANAYRGKRLNLSAVIRNKDGSPVGNIKEIKNTARIRFLSTMSNLSIPLHAPQHQTGLWWKTYRPNEWQSALHHLEVSHPVVAYCANHWKAEEIYRVVIQTCLDSERAKKKLKRQEETKEARIAGPIDVSTTTKLQKRPHSAIDNSSNGPSSSLEQPPQKKQKGHELPDGSFLLIRGW